jgi:hypothetical protein
VDLWIDVTDYLLMQCSHLYFLHYCFNYKIHSF